MLKLTHPSVSRAQAPSSHRFSSSKALKLLIPHHHYPIQPSPMSCTWELLGLHQLMVPQKPFPAKAQCHEQTNTVFSPTNTARTSQTQTHLCTNSALLFFLCSPNTLTILILSIQEKPMSFQLTILYRFERVFQAWEQLTTHAEWPGNWA